MRTAIEALDAAATAARRAANCQDPNIYREALYALGRAYLDAHPTKQAAPRVATAFMPDMWLSLATISTSHMPPTLQLPSDQGAKYVREMHTPRIF